jgi:hypothetical protein
MSVFMLDSGIAASLSLVHGVLPNVLGYCFFFVGWDFRYCGHFWPIVPALGDGDCGEICGMKIGKRSTRREPTPAPLCPPQIPPDVLD